MEHLVLSASATYLKGLYHLFVLERDLDADAYATGLRTYQALFFLVSTGVLLDSSFRFHRTQRPDPAAQLEHKDLREWKGFPDSHQLQEICRESQKALTETWDTRNNLNYRPYMMTQGKNGGAIFEDCELQDLLANMPKPAEIKALYARFLEAIGRWNASGDSRAARFLEHTITWYEDRAGKLPTMMLPSRYATVLHKSRSIPQGFHHHEHEWFQRLLAQHQPEPLR